MRNANPHPRNPMGLKFENPAVFDMSVSVGSKPLLWCPVGNDHDTPANVVPIENVRKPCLPETPFEKGYRVRVYGGSLACNPYRRPEQRAEWAAGWQSGC